MMTEQSICYNLAFVREEPISDYTVSSFVDCLNYSAISQDENLFN